MKGRAGEIEPVVVTEARRGQGIGRALLEHVAAEARRRGLTYLTISPSHATWTRSGACTRRATTCCPPCSSRSIWAGASTSGGTALTCTSFDLSPSRANTHGSCG
ncbi:GNAT family N-acetyltransferase [Phytohabitans rumicis]|uniref:GNAT family N-acetyltransferase n=1 Tax=Phytohabitans rumicis TaxID=1076125 RepID=UPI001FE3AAF4|nr:GNAT family N-acetyltransferase [Phytohabitans rumicis]